jgi:hypothetical protein
VRRARWLPALLLASCTPELALDPPPVTTPSCASSTRCRRDLVRVSPGRYIGSVQAASFADDVTDRWAACTAFARR